MCVSFFGLQVALQHKNRLKCKIMFLSKRRNTERHLKIILNVIYIMLIQIEMCADSNSTADIEPFI